MNENTEQIAVRIRRVWREHLSNTAGAIDLASIMVGVIVIGIIAGVISATVFAVIPWAQDEAAKSSLDSVRIAESVAQVRAGGYLGLDDLVDGRYLATGSDGLSVLVDDAENCYLAGSKSVVGNIFFTSSDDSEIHKYEITSTEPGCIPLADLIADLGGS